MANSVEDLIGFSLLSDELNDEEYSQFVLQYIRARGRKRITSAIFSEFNSGTDPITPFADMITSIINTRAPQLTGQVRQEEQAITCLEQLPSALIGECASYLDASEYFEFVKVSRLIYQATNTSPRLYALPLQFVHRSLEATYHMKLFRNIKRVRIDAGHYYRQPATTRGHLPFQSIRELHLFVGNAALAMQFAEDEAFDNCNVQNLRIGQLDCESDVLWKIMRKFPLLQLLELSGIHINMTGSEQNLLNNAQFQNLNTLCIGYRCSVDLSLKLIKATQHQLETLKIWGELDIAVGPFPKLKVVDLFVY